MLKRFLVTKVYVVEANDAEEAISLTDTAAAVEQSADTEEINDDLIGPG